MRPNITQPITARLHELVQQPGRTSHATPQGEIARVPFARHASIPPRLLLVDANEERAQRLARILTLADYRPCIAKTPLQAFGRLLQEPSLPQAIILGWIDDRNRFAFTRLFQWMVVEQGQNIPIIALPQSRYILIRLLQQLAYELRRDIPFTVLLRPVPDEAPLIAHPSSPAIHVVSRASAQVLEGIWRVLPGTRSSFRAARHSLVLDVLPITDLQPRVSRKLRSRNSHFRQLLRAARELIDPAQWDTLLRDVGLGSYCSLDAWPPDDDEHTIPAEYLSCLNQAVAFSQPDDPVGQLLRWGNRSTQISLEKRIPSRLTQQALKVFPEEQAMSAALNAFTGEMNGIRGEDLHVWKRWSDGSYRVVHYSNLYAYGRVRRPQMACHAWVASIEAMLSLLQLDSTWMVSEIECSCQTQTGHCVFALQPLGEAGSTNNQWPDVP
jgi:hypothetical protein